VPTLPPVSYAYAQIRPEPDLGKLVFWLQNNRPDGTNGVNNTVSCCEESMQFSDSFATSPFPSSWINSWHGNQFGISFAWVTLSIIANTPPDRSAALVLSVINWTYYSTGIGQIRVEIWPDYWRMAKSRFAKAMMYAVTLCKVEA